MNRRINESAVLKIMIFFGLTLQGVVAFVVSTVDERGVLTKLCKHASDSNLELVSSFKSVSGNLFRFYNKPSKDR